MNHRTSPAYQEYASALLANRNYKEMSLAAKGLLHHIRLECWENGNVPSDPNRLARIIGCTNDEALALLPECMSFLSAMDGVLISPGIEDYRARLTKTSEARSAAGKIGGKSKANARNLSQQNTDTVNQTKPSQTHAVKGRSVTTVPMHSTEHEEWLKEYGNA